MSTACIICEVSRSKPFCRKEKASYLQCLGCGHVYVERILNEQELLNKYATRKSHHASETKEQWDFSATKAAYVYTPLLKKIEAITKPGRILDIGCSNGSFLYQAKERGWEGYGIELETGSLQIARKHGLDVFQGELKDRHFPDNHFSAVTLWQVIEHIYDPRELLQEIARILVPGGILALSTPNIQSIAWHLLREEWGSIEPAVHLNLFRPSGLAKLVNLCGLKTVRLETLDLKPSTVQMLLNRVKKSEKKSAISVANLASELPSNKMKVLLNLRYAINIPLKSLAWGEDIYAYFRKMDHLRKENA